MVKIRLMRVGKRKQPSYRVVVADSRSPRDGRIIESIGHYQPRRDPSVIDIDNERALYWLQRGAQPSDPVRKLLELSGAWSSFTGKPATAQLKQSPEQPGAPTPRATPAASIRATPAASVDEEPAELPEAVDQQGAAPDADVTDEPS